jgi:rhamnosyl/mannosyltransferase
MNVLHVYKTSIIQSHGGVEKFIDTLCKADSMLGVKNTFLTLSKKPARYPIKMDGYTIHQTKQNLFVASTGFSLSAFSTFKKLVRQANIVHYHFPNPFADILHILCSPKKPSIVTYHSDIVKQKIGGFFYRPLKSYFLNSVDHIVATSPNYLRSSSVLQTYSDKTSIVPIGIDIHSYPRLDPQRLAFWEQRLKKPFFLFIGTLRYYKGLHIALDAIAGTNMRMAIAGAGGIEKKLRSQAKFLKLDNVDFLGDISEEDKVALLDLCYAFVFPSHLRSEAFGISLLEAAAFGKPMITCEIGTGTTFVNQAGKTGLVINPDSPSELRQAMKYLIECPSVVAEMGANAQKRVYDFFTAEKQAQSYFNLCQSLISRKV